MSQNRDEFSNKAVLAAVDRWAKDTFGAPKRLSDLVTEIAIRDQHVRRVATHVVRRTLREQRQASRDRRGTSPTVAAERIDAFAYSQDSLRRATEHVVACRECRGSGQAKCRTCDGTGRTACSSCRGSGKQRSEKTGRPINCKACRGKADTQCAHCDAAGTIDCPSCLASGHQSVWQTYEETTSWAVAMDAPESISAAHPSMRESRPLGDTDWAMFSLVQKAEKTGPLEASDLSADDHMFVVGRSKLNDRLERATHQQFVKLAVVRRDARYTMCGTDGVLVLSGRSLIGGSTDEALRPIKHRLFLWPILTVIAALAAWMARDAALGDSAYFNSVKQWSAGVWLAGVVFSVPAFGGLLRAWRGGVHFFPFYRRENVTAAGAAICLIALIVGGALAAPSPSQVATALAKGEVQRARLVVDALNERKPSASVVALEDDVMMFEAKSGSVDQRLALLNQVADRGGKRAAEATFTGLAIRHGELQRLINLGDARASLARIANWFPRNAPTDPQTAELAAQAHTLNAQVCPDAPCRLAEQRAAYASAPSSERAAQVNRTRASILAVFDSAPEAGDTVSKLRHNKAVIALATTSVAAGAGDQPFVEAAQAAVQRASEGLQGVAAVGATRDVVEELFGSLQPVDATAARTTFGGADVYAAFDPRGVCKGLYAVGTKASSSRRLSTEAAEKLLGQAVGQSVQLKVPSTATEEAKWSEHGVRVLARWHDSNLVELRIGSAEP